MFHLLHRWRHQRGRYKTFTYVGPDPGPGGTSFLHHASIERGGVGQWRRRQRRRFWLRLISAGTILFSLGWIGSLSLEALNFF